MTEQGISSPPGDEKSQESKRSTDKQTPSPLRRISYILILFLLFWTCLGAWLYPAWWYAFVFEGGFRHVDTWVGGLGWFLSNYIVLILTQVFTIWMILALSRTNFPNKLRDLPKAFWEQRIKKRWIFLFIAILASLTAASVFSSEVRSREERELNKRLAENSRKLDEEMKKLTADLKGDDDPLPLSEPTKFIFLDKDTIESLYGQNEPDLVPAVITVEIKDSTELKGAVNIEDFLKTEYGRQVFNNRVTEYRKTPKTTERKLKDLLTYLIEKNPQKRFRNVESKSDDIKKLDEATQLLTLKYDVLLDKEKLRMLRDRLLTEERYRLEQLLEGLHGLTIIEGDWIVETRPDAYVLKRPFIENVTAPPLCEVKILKGAITTQDRSIIEGLATKRMRLTIFGNVLAGMSNDSKTVFLTPIAIF